ncbi:DUF4391 domain-containing protein [Sphingomonas sp. LHG3406-1]|uniref:DUF4391 domain-containing protein n=1 Tax=Sphingomonas sp. LHG3406-1 TaxID=2804617 RepID=UPI0026149C38|nr:DUF4391 domain-containing protein [Sphingomonas sp. LHG3406-1]
MKGEPITLEALAAALALPPGPPSRRIAKSTLADFVPTGADRKLIDGKLARLDWLAAINPAATGVPSGEVDGLVVDTINVIAARTRGPASPRLAEILHRAIPKPVVLLYSEEGSDMGATLCLAPKRSAEREIGRTVLTALFDTGPLTQAEEGFLAELALPRLPSRDLASLYAGLIERVEALKVSRAGERPFRLATSMTEQAAWRTTLGEIAQLEGEVAQLAAAIRKERRLSAKVALGEKVRQAKSRMDENRMLLK